MADFLATLGQQLNNQFSVGENTNNSLDAVVDGKNVKYGSLGDLSKRIDQSAERRYVEEGYLRKDPYNTDPKQFEILMQEPSATVLIKKKMFSSIGENFRPDFMDIDEKLYYKTIRILFQNKCRQVAALEKLSKIQKITSAVGNVSDQLIPIIISLTDDAGSGFSVGGPDLFGGINSNGDISNFTKVVDRIRRVYAFNTSAETTSWITDSTNLFQSQFGQGTGVIEITGFTNLNTSVGLDIRQPGNFGLTISDPYEAMLITEYDIERAISDATNSYYNHKIFQFGKENADQLINDLKVRLNQLRSDRKASPISFRVSSDTLLGKRVVAILDRIGTTIPFNYNSGFGGIGSGVTVADEYLKGGAIAGYDGLEVSTQPTFGSNSNVKKLFPDSELAVFKRLVTNIFNKLQLEANSNNTFQLSNQKTNYARRKLRQNFAGKLIIQPMDTCHIYLNSKSRYDSKLLSGLNNMFTGAGILQNLNKTFTDFKNAADTLFNPAGSVNFQLEKTAFVGPDFPNYLWALIRSQFITEREGTHIFAGVVETAADNWSDGKFMVDVRGNDNTTYFDMGKVNFKPGIDTFNGSLFDPLTPFKTRFDRISSNAKDETPELLDENKYILGTSQDTDSPIVKFKLGPNAGQRATQDNYVQDRSIDDTTGFITKTFYAPDGLVYKWKEGIGVLVQFGNSLDLNDPTRVGAPSITKEPFAGQDVMNVLSLLITGQPYNFANYWKAVANFDGFARDPQSQQDSAYSYYDSLKSDLNKNNIIWGNFIPFKNLVMDEQSYAQVLQAQFKAQQRNADLDSKLQKLADLRNKSLLMGAGADLFKQNDASYSSDQAKINNQATTLSKEINDIIAEMQRADKSFSSLKNIGNDTSIDFNQFIDSSKASKQASDPNIRKLVRRQINNLTRRMSYNVRGNEDKNLFIVDDFYDKDYDILAYEQSLTDGLKLYNNEFTSVRDKIAATADLLNLEVFCDTQGHIRVRPPQYNRMPSTIFYKMMYLKKSYNIQLFPQFLEDLFTDQITALKQRLEILEDQIRLDCSVLGINDDDSAVDFILNGATENTGDTFSFLSEEDSGQISNIANLLKQANPDQRDAEQDNTFSSLEKQVNSTKDIFSNTQRAKVILDSLEKNKLNQAGYSINNVAAFEANNRVNYLISRIQTVSGQKIPKSSYLVIVQSVAVNDVTIPIAKTIDIFKITTELADKIRERQKIMKLFYSAVKNSAEYKSLDSDQDSGNALFMPGNFSNSNIPEVFEHMIEDESYDDYGPGSGARFIIKRSQILNLSITESPPRFNMVEVQGVLNPLAPNALPAGLNSFPGQGNGMVTAAAVDYDMWRNYGLRQGSPINVPFLSDPNNQCAPYASMILSRARREVLRGSLTISGNEFMQPGEVVYLEDRGLLFYVNSVRHAYAQGSSFTTTLELTYGHTMGDYIPVPLDVIGKLIYNNKDSSSFIVQRQSNSSSDSNVGVVQRDPSKPSSQVINDGEKDTPTTSFMAANTQTLNNILYTSAYLINANNTKGNTIKASVELRVYYDDSTPLNSDIITFASSVKDSLTIEGMGPKQVATANTGSARNVTLDKNDVIVVFVNMSDDDDRRSPSQKAIDAARNQIATSSNPGNTSKDKIRQSLFNYIVDCWVKFEPVSQEEANGTT
jgi:hypothetical protein